MDVDSWNADGVVFTGHKSLLGIQAQGVLYKKGAFPETIKIRRYRAENSQQLTYENGDYEYEVGTQNIRGIRASCRGLSIYFKSAGQDTEKRRNDDGTAV